MVVNFMIALLCLAPPVMGGLTPATNTTAPIRHRLPDSRKNSPGRRPSANRQHDSFEATSLHYLERVHCEPALRPDRTAPRAPWPRAAAGATCELFNRR